MSPTRHPKNFLARHHDEEPTDLAVPERREIVAETAMVFGTDAARELASYLGLTLADAADEIERLRAHSY